MLRRSVLLGLVALLLLPGCGRIPFLARPVDNFTAYYNTFYNARKAFDRGLEGVEREDAPIDRTAYLSLFTTPATTGAGRDFETAILKGADVLRDHPDSRWVDDALLLIGKSYFYQRNYVGAEQKFRETIALETGLEDEARFWLARALIAGRAYEEATEHLTLSLAREGLSRRWEAMLRLALGELYVERGAWEQAAEELAQGLERVRDRDVGGRAQFLLAQVYETMGRFEQATTAFERVQRFKPLYQLSYAAQYSRIRLEAQHGEADLALRLLRRMERDGKNYESRGELAYQRGRTYQAMGRPEDALDTYEALLYESDANLRSVRGPTFYALGELYYEAYDDYLLAAAHFDTAASALPEPPNTSGALEQAPEAILDAQERAIVFGSFAATADQMAEMDSLLYLGTMDEETFQAFVLELRQQRAEEMAEQQREQRRRQAEAQFQNSGFSGGTETQSSGSAASGGGEAGFLFHLDRARVEDGRQRFLDVWGERPLVPNWRRLEAVRTTVAAQNDPTEAAGGSELAQAGGLDEVGLGLPEIDISEVPRDSAAQATLRAERAMVRYELANVLFLAMSKPDSAVVWYRTVIEEDADQPVAERAYYALAEAQRALGDSLAAERLYREVLRRNPDAALTDRVRLRLGITDPVETTADSLSLAEEAYAAAYAQWQAREYAQALDDMFQLALNYEATTVAPRALFATGTIFMEWARRDTFDVLGPVPVSVADSVLILEGFVDPPAPDTTATLISPDTTLALPDTALALPDTALSVPDSAMVPPGPALAPPDSVSRVQGDLDSGALGGATTGPVDSLAVGESPATPEVAADTQQGVGAPADSLMGPMEALPDAPPPSALRLPDLFAQLSNRYPESPQAERGTAILATLDEEQRRREAEAQAVLDSLAALEQARLDSLMALQEPPRAPSDSTGMPADTMQVAPGSPPSDADSLRADGAQLQEPAEVPEEPPVYQPGSPREASSELERVWVVAVHATADLTDAEAVMALYQEVLPEATIAAYPTDAEDGTIMYRVGVGAFRTPMEADTFRQLERAQLPDASELIRVARQR
ncbi:MAG: tetratricopeptide repeat protein [Bacteroidota bacterium]